MIMGILLLMWILFLKSPKQQKCSLHHADNPCEDHTGCVIVIAWKRKGVYIVPEGTKVCVCT